MTTRQTGNVVNLRNAGRDLRQSEYLPFPPGPLPRSRGDGGTEFAGLRPVRLWESAMTGAAFSCQHLHSADRVQGEALLSVGEAHNNLFPVPACGAE